MNGTFPRAAGWYMAYGARPRPFADDQEPQALADALEELAAAVRSGAALGGKVKLWPPQFTAETKVGDTGVKSVLIGIQLEEPPAACAEAAEMFGNGDLRS